MDTKAITAQVPLPLANKIDQLASRLERSPSWVVKEALGAWVEQQEEHQRLTLEALAGADAGRVSAPDTVAASFLDATPHDLQQLDLASPRAQADIRAMLLNLEVNAADHAAFMAELETLRNSAAL